MLDDAELLRRYAEDRSEAAFAELVRRHLDLVYSAALRRVGGDSHLAEDVCQKVFVGLASQADSLRKRDTITGWLYTASRFAAAEVVRSEQRRRTREQESYRMNELTADSESTAEWERLRPVLDEAMDELAERDREALLLRFFEGRALAEVGGRLAVSEEAARKCVDRALERLRALLAKRGIASTSAAIALLLANQTVAAAPAALAATVATSALLTSSASGPALTIFQLMRTSKTAVGVAVVFLGLSGFTALQTLWSRQEAENTLASVVHESAQAMAKRLELEARIGNVTEAAAELKRRVEQTQADEKAKAARSVADAEAAKTAARTSPENLGAAFMSRHPEVRQALVEWNAASQNFTYGPLYRKLGLSADQIAELQRLGRENSGFSRDVNGKITSFQLGTGMSRQELESRRRELLGVAGYDELMRYGNSIPARDMAAQVASELTFSDRPLTAQQYDQVTEILARGRITARSPQPRAFDWERVLAESQAVLSREQLAVLERMQVQDEFQQAWSGVSATKPTAPARSAAKP